MGRKQSLRFAKSERTQLNKDNLTEKGDYPALNGGISSSGHTENWNTESDTITISEGGISGSLTSLEHASGQEGIITHFNSSVRIVQSITCIST